MPTEQLPEPNLMTLSELAVYLRVSERVAYGLAQSRRVPAVKVGGQWRISRAALRRQLGEQPDAAA